MPRAKDPKVTLEKSTYNQLVIGLVVAVALSSFFGGYILGSRTAAPQGLTGKDVADLMLAMQTGGLPVEERAAGEPPTTIAPVRQEPTQQQGAVVQVSVDDDPVKGDTDAPVTIIEFSDFQCPFCSRFAAQTLPQIEENYLDTGKAKMVYRDLPLDNLHPNARPAAIAAECADEQGKFWEYHDILFEKQSEWGRLSINDARNTFIQYATDLGLGSGFDTCLDSPEIAAEVNKDFQDGQSLGVTGTPTFFIGTEEGGYVKVVGAQPFSVFQSAIDAELGL